MARHGRRRATSSTPRRRPTKDAAAPTVASEPPAGPFVLGAVAGATPGKWIDVWRERMPRTALDLRPVAVPEQRESLLDGTLDAALVRLPIESTGLHVIALYDELPVVVAASDSHLAVADELVLADLDGETLIHPDDGVLTVPIAAPATPAATTADAVALAAAGAGILVVPMSIARLHARRDTIHRVLTDGPSSSVALAWPADRTTPLVETFVGIVRGRTANSSR